MRGGRILPRLAINPKFRAHVHALDRAHYGIALEAGISFHSKFSWLVNARVVPASATNIERLEKIADAVGFPRDEVFITGGAQ